MRMDQLTVQSSHYIPVLEMMVHQVSHLVVLIVITSNLIKKQQTIKHRLLKAMSNCGQLV